ncbi:AMP-binding protein [Dyadobacter pollutisoli]|uniref:AMP-binding protein n=1 Tax=Dyadobacter pollutisoli TaxID=2910158 RepID=A0A9E8NGA4_9BACT|nr:AMP-binding protein [Dyadobacter pollutisoli]WAC14421.1 AMP-binding protein [Dyadobacter pollutisoli]
MMWKINTTELPNTPRPEHAYFSKVFDFMESWRQGQMEFTLQTSGSTGTPKPIQVTRKQLTASALMTGKALQIGKGTRALVSLNASYIAGLMMLVRGMELDWELTIVEPSSNPMIGLPQDEHFDFVAMVPMQLTACLEDSRTRQLVNNLGKILLGGAPVGVSLQKKVSDLQIPVYQSYGMTETVSHVALKKLNGRDVTGRYFFLPGINFGTDARGCLFVSGEVTNQLVVQTNDLVEISGNTFEWIGRADNVINSGGIKIILDIVDGLIAEVFHDLNLMNSFFTWYQPDEKLGQKLVLIIEGSAELVVETDILAEIRARVSAYETPKHVYFVDQFIKTATDKVDKRETVQQLFGS